MSTNPHIDLIECRHPECSHKFQRKLGQASRTLYCSDECKNGIRSYRKRANRKAVRDRRAKPCKYCGSNFENPNGQKIFCKTDCKTQWHVDRLREENIIKREIKTRNKNISKVCKCCQAPYKAKNNKAMYCSDRCKMEVRYRRNLELKNQEDIVIDPFYLTRGDPTQNNATGASAISGAA